MLTIERFDDVWSDFDSDAYARRNPNSLLYVSQRYIDLTAGHLDARPSWLVARRGADVVGYLPFMTKEGPLGPVVNSMAYYGSNGSVVQAECDDQAKAALIERFYDDAAQDGACSATLITNPLEHDAEFYEGHCRATYRDERIGQITQLPSADAKDTLMSLFSNPRPRNIRRAMKEGIQVEARQDDAALDFLFKTHVVNMEAIGGLSKSWSFFADTKAKMAPEDWTIYVATLDGEPISALLLFYFNKTVEYFTPVTVERFRNAQPLALIVHDAMLDAIDAGFAYWNWGGTWKSQGGVYDYKKRWGTTDHPYFYYVRLLNEAVLQQAPDALLEQYPGFYVLPFGELT